MLGLLVFTAVPVALAGEAVVTYQSFDAAEAVTAHVATEGERAWLRVDGGGGEADGEVWAAQVERRFGGRDRVYRVQGRALFTLVDRGRTTLVGGTAVRYAELHLRGRGRAIRVRRSAVPGAPSAEALRAAYRRRVGFLPKGEATEPEARARVQAALRDVRQACSAGDLSVELDWASFTRAGHPALAGVTRAYLGALQRLCRDADYAEAVRALSVVRVRATGGSTHEMRVRDRALELGLSSTQPNPQQAALAWLTSHL